MTVAVLRGDAGELPLPDESVDLVLTSPPYYRQRDYQDGGESLAGQIGCEDTPREYLANLLGATREWVRVLKRTGSLFVVIDDKYSGYTGTRWGHGRSLDGPRGPARVPRGGPVRAPELYGIPNKSLMGLPWRYALACVDDLGLILREDIIGRDGGAYVWAKANGMPESVNDRCRRAHEYIFHFVKGRHYFSAVDLIRVPHTMRPQRRPNGHKQRQHLGVLPAQTYSTSHRDETGVDGHPLGKLPGSVWEFTSAPLVVPEHLEHRRCCGGRKRPGCAGGLDHHAAFPPALADRIIRCWSPTAICLGCGCGRFPVTSSEPVHLRPGDTPGGNSLNSDRVHGYDRRAGTHVLNMTTILGYACACTPHTDHPERRRPSVTPGRDKGRGSGDNDARAAAAGTRHHGNSWPARRPVRDYDLHGWQPPPTRPAVVLDPCGGTGTTALTAALLGRHAITVDLSADYCHLAAWRTQDPGERARAAGVPKPPPETPGQLDMFTESR